MCGSSITGLWFWEMDVGTARYWYISCKHKARPINNQGRREGPERRSGAGLEPYPGHAGLKVLGLRLGGAS